MSVAPAELRHGRVLVARLDSLGDVLLAGPAVRAVARSAAEVTLLVGSGRSPVAGLLPGVDAVIEFDAPWVVLDPKPLDAAAVSDLVERVAAARVDAALVLTSYHQSPLPLALLLRMAGVPWVGAVSDDYPGSLLDLRHRVPDGIPEVERSLSLVEAAGFGPTTPEQRRLAVRRPLPDPVPLVGSAPYVVVHPGAATSARRSTPEHGRAMVAALVEAGYRVVVTGSGAESPLTAEVADGRALDLAGRLDLPLLAAVLDRARVVVAPNTGPAHLAAAVGTPVVSLFAPVVAASAWAPYGVPVVLLGDQQAACRSSRARVCPVAGHPCLTSIIPAEVVAAVRRLDVAAPSSPGPATGPDSRREGASWR